MAASHGITSDVLEYRQPLSFTKYRISNRGEIQSICSGSWKPLTPMVHPRAGHLYVCLRHEGKGHVVTVHKLVLLTFVGPPPTGMECRHLNGNPADNRVENLQWGTSKENNEDTTQQGRRKFKRNKLSFDDIVACRKLHENGASITRLAGQFGVHWDTMSRAVSDKPSEIAALEKRRVENQ